MEQKTQVLWLQRDVLVLCQAAHHKSIVCSTSPLASLLLWSVVVCRLRRQRLTYDGGPCCDSPTSSRQIVLINEQKYVGQRC